MTKIEHTYNVAWLTVAKLGLGAIIMVDPKITEELKLFLCCVWQSLWWLQSAHSAHCLKNCFQERGGTREAEWTGCIMQWKWMSRDVEPREDCEWQGSVCVCVCACSENCMLSICFEVCLRAVADVKSTLYIIYTSVLSDVMMLVKKCQLAYVAK